MEIDFFRFYLKLITGPYSYSKSHSRSSRARLLRQQPPAMLPAGTPKSLTLFGEVIVSRIREVIVNNCT